MTLEAGVEPDHLRAMLKDAFSLQAVPVALTATADGTVLPMSLVAREPSLLDGGDYTIVLAKRPPALLAGSVPTPTDPVTLSGSGTTCASALVSLASRKLKQHKT